MKMLDVEKGLTVLQTVEDRANYLEGVLTAMEDAGETDNPTYQKVRLMWKSLGG